MSASKQKSTVSPAAIRETKSTGSVVSKAPSSPAPKADHAPTSSAKPDKAAFEAEKARIQAEIDALQTKLAAVREKLAQAGRPDTKSDERSALRAELDSLRGQSSDSKLSRDKISEEIKNLQDSIQKQVKELQAARAKSQFRTVAEADARIESLEKQVESGSMKLADEKRAIMEISNTRRNRKTVEGFQRMQDAIEANRHTVDELRKQLDDPEAKATYDRYKTVKAEIDELNKEADEVYARRSKINEERDAIQGRLNALYEEKRENVRQFREANDRYWTKVNEDRARRQERARLQRAAEEAQKKLETAQRLREEAALPAFQAQIEDCQTLIDALSSKTSVNVELSSAASPAKAAVAGVPELELRKVEDVGDGLVVRKKKGEEEEAYFVGKQKKGKKDKAVKAESTLNLPLPVLRALLSLSIPAPTGHNDVARVIEDLKTKKAWFVANQARVTAESVAKAEAEIHRLTLGTRYDNDLETSTASRVESPVHDAEVTEPPTPIDGAQPGSPEADGDVSEVGVQGDEQ